MSKSIYEEALDNTQTLLALVNLKELNSKKKLDMLNQIEQALELAIKQKKLLGLYKKLNETRKELIILARHNSWSWKLDLEIIDLNKQIKELENEKD